MWERGALVPWEPSGSPPPVPTSCLPWRPSGYPPRPGSSLSAWLVTFRALTRPGCLLREQDRQGPHLRGSLTPGGTMVHTQGAALTRVPRTRCEQQWPLLLLRCGCSSLSPTNFPSLRHSRGAGAGLRLGTLVPLTIWWPAAAGTGWRGEGSKGGLLLLTKQRLTGHQICQCLDLRILRPHMRVGLLW